MPWREGVVPERMARVAVVAPVERLASVLVALQPYGAVELEGVDTDSGPEQAAAAAIGHGSVAALVGWSPKSSVAPLAERAAPLGGAVVSLALPRGVDPPTLVERSGPTGVLQPIVDTYATMPYADVDPALFAGLAYMVMFGMMFGDVGHGALVVAGGLLLRAGWPRSLRRLRHLAPFVIGAGLAAMGFGFAYGEFFGPTHVVPTAWLAPLDHPTTLLAVAVAAGGGLLAVSYLIGIVNRFREGGLSRALFATSGLAGASVYLGLGLIGLGWYLHAAPALVAGAASAGAGLLFGFAGSYLSTGGVFPAAVEVFDSVVRIGTNTVSFARLAAFGLTHAALGSVIWSGTTGLWHRGPALWLAAAVLFVVGNAVALALEGLVAGVQALRLDYYELFSRIFVGVGRPFRPWRGGMPSAEAGTDPPTSTVRSNAPQEATCSLG